MNQVVDQFHKHYYTSLNWREDLSWCGVKILKNPLDLFLMQELIWEVRPDLIIETGTAWGGSALFYAHLMDHMGGGEIITIDARVAPYIPASYEPPKHQRITYLVGSSTDPGVVEVVRTMPLVGDKVLVVLDSDHSRDHVAQELRAYSSLVTPGSYLVVEDTNTDLVLEGFGPGPSQAVEDFLRRDQVFVTDEGRARKFGFSFNTWLRRL